MKQDYRNHKIVVVGAGKSGLALVRYFSSRGGVVALSDHRAKEGIGGLESLADLSVRYDLGGHSRELFEAADLVAVSPGVPFNLDVLKRARACNIPVLGEIEIAAREIETPIIGVTGTNGKSTTTTLIGSVFESQAEDVFVGGNLGEPLVSACDRRWSQVVVELSSFQLETVVDFRPQIALLLNLSADHLDRYDGLEDYYQAKLKLFANMKESDYAVLNADDGDICRLSEQISATKVWFSAQGRLVEGLTRLGNRLVWSWRGVELSLPLNQLRLKGEHNVENAMAALVPALLKGCDAESAWRAICDFGGLKHRMQMVRRLNGVDWYNDSKGTNVGSVMKSLSGLGQGVFLIAGGKDKGGDYRSLRPLLEQKVKHLVLLGEAAQRMEDELSGACLISVVDGLEEAVSLAWSNARQGDTVLLSPACSSFDMFTSFEVRGERFEQLVANLPEEKVTV